MERKFSYLYTEFVENENDMIGHIAYSLYKSNKIQYIKQYKEDNEDKTPSEDDLEAFHKVSRTTVSALKIQAQQILLNFTQVTLDETVSEIEDKIKENQENRLKEIINPIIPKNKSPWDGFWMSVLVKGTQTAVVGFFIFLIVFAASASKVGFWNAVKGFIPGSDKSSSNQTEQPIEQEHK